MLTRSSLVTLREVAAPEELSCGCVVCDKLFSFDQKAHSPTWNQIKMILPDSSKM